MKLEHRITALFQMTDETWERHANPWSVWTRFTAFPALILAAWSRKWIGGWATIPMVGALLWTWLNPRLFDKPASTDNWASKAVLGERVWLNRDAVPIPKSYTVLPLALNGASAVALLVSIWGLARLSIRPTLLGAGVAVLLKVWFLDQMVRLYDETR